MSKKVYRIGEAAKLLGVKTSTLRFWEDKFSQIRPRRTDTDQRYYSEKDMQLLRRIHGLLHEEGMTIAGVQKILKRPEKASTPPMISLGPVKSIRLAGALISFAVPRPLIGARPASFHTPFHASINASMSEKTLPDVQQIPLSSLTDPSVNEDFLKETASSELVSSELVSSEIVSSEIFPCDSSKTETILRTQLEEENKKCAQLKNTYTHNLLGIKKELEELLALLPTPYTF